MNCIKCGRETANSQIFCPDCLDGMNVYPVKPGTPVVLPPLGKESAAPSRPAKRRPASQEEQLQQLRSSVRWLSFGLIAALAAFVAAALMVLWLLDGPDFLGEMFYMKQYLPF